MQNSPDHILNMNPRHSLLTRANRTSEGQLKGRQHTRQSTLLTQHNASAQIANPTANGFKPFSTLLPGFTQQVRESINRIGMFIHWHIARAIITNSGATDHQSRFALSLGKKLIEAVGEINSTIIETLLAALGPAPVCQWLAGQIEDHLWRIVRVQFAESLN